MRGPSNKIEIRGGGDSARYEGSKDEMDELHFSSKKGMLNERLG